jgi:FAD/FMN-containing dehydrogenase
MDSQPQTAAAQSLNGKFGGELIRPGDPNYDEARALFNGMIDRRPALIARCTSDDDVIAALAYARANELPLAIRGGAHSTPGYSTVDEGVVIDVAPMKTAEVDPARKTMRAGAGLTWGELDAASQEHGLAITGGRVSNTGVAGLTLGSGSGWLQRRCGLTADSLIGARLVTADGRVVRASEDENPELLWGLKGGGGNFGVVTEFEFKLHDVGPIILAGPQFYPRERAPELLAFYRDLITEAPDELSGGVALIHGPPLDFVPEEIRGKPVVGIIVCYAGDPEEGEKVIKPLRDLGPAADMVGPMPYVALQQMLDAGSPKGSHEYFKIDFLRELPEEAIEAMVGAAAKTPSPMTQVVLEPLGGAMSRVPADSAALPRPDVPFAYHCLSLWPDGMPDEPNIEWARSFAAAMEPWSVGAAYANFVAEDEGEARLKASYGPEKFARLVALKDEWDPDNVFRLNHNVPPSAPAPS